MQLWDGQPPYPKPAAVWHNTVPATSWRQLAALWRLQDAICAHPALQEMPLATTALHALDLQAQGARSPWLPQTHQRELLNLEGALSTLGKYAVNVDFGIALSASSTWRTAKTAWGHLAIQSQPVHQVAATADDIAQAVELSPDPEIRAFLICLWLMCARKGDVAHLRTGDVSLNAQGRLSFFVQEGKGVRARRGKYTVTSHCPPAWREELQRFLTAPRTSRNLFRPSLGVTSEVLDSLRTANPAANCRSVRRGALQAIAMDPEVDEPTLMRMSGHRSVATLHRYLDWDRINARSHQLAQNAARNLAPTRSPVPPPQQH